MRRLILVLFLPLALAACGAEPVWAPDAAVQRAIYRSAEPPSVTLYTMINNRSGEGGHSGLLINGSQRLLFDPAGSWEVNIAPERNDVHFGMTPGVLASYLNFHARPTFHVVAQTRQVSPETAEYLLRRVQEYGAVPKAMCANSISSILGETPGFESLDQTYFPVRLQDSFATLPGVSTRKYYDNDENNATPVEIVDVMMTRP